MSKRADEAVAFVTDATQGMGCPDFAIQTCQIFMHEPAAVNGHAVPDAYPTRRLI